MAGRKTNAQKCAEAEAAEATLNSEVEKRVAERVGSVDQVVEQKLNEALAPILAKLTNAQGDVPVARAEGATSTVGVLEALAMQIATLTDQGTGRRHVPPEIVKQRKEAFERLLVLLAEAKRNKTPPSYEVLNKTLLDNQMVEPMWVDSAHRQQRTKIDYYGIPNEVMRPANEVAEAIFAAFTDSIGSTVKVVPDEPVGMTPNGLVVHGRAIPTYGRGPQQPLGEPPQTGGADTSMSGLKVHHHQVGGQFVEKRIHGTIAEPARETV